MAHNSKFVLRKWALFGHEGIHEHALQLYGSIKIYRREFYMDKIEMLFSLLEGNDAPGVADSGAVTHGLLFAFFWNAL